MRAVEMVVPSLLPASTRIQWSQMSPTTGALAAHEPDLKTSHWPAGYGARKVYNKYPAMPIHVYVCMYACMHACMHVCRYACVYVCTYMYVCTYVCVYVCMHVCMHVCTYMYVRMNVCMHVCMYVCMYVCTYVGYRRNTKLRQ